MNVSDLASSPVTPLMVAMAENPATPFITVNALRIVIVEEIGQKPIKVITSPL
jgi:hypothetical protein